MNVIKNNLLMMQDAKYLSFHSKICKNVNLIGIPVPRLRIYAKELLTFRDASTLLEIIDNEYYEEILLKGLIIGLDKCCFDVLKKRIVTFIPLIDNWAICDTFCASLKLTKKYYKEMFFFINPYFMSNKTYELRFAVVMFLDYFISREYMKIVFPLIINIKNDDYYVKMAISWALSVCLIKDYEYTLSFIKTSHLDDFIYNMTIKKACESYRLNESQKNYLRSIKR